MLGGYILLPGGYIPVPEGYIPVPGGYIPVPGGYIWCRAVILFSVSIKPSRHRFCLILAWDWQDKIKIPNIVAYSCQTMFAQHRSDQIVYQGTSPPH